MISRDEYLSELVGYKDEDLIKVVTGIRRCGKSTLFKLYINYLRDSGVKESQIISINLEDPLYQFSNYLDLYNYIKGLLVDDCQYYVFIDEVQTVSEFQKAVDGLYIKSNVDLYITGSNAYLLSGELATLLTGRYIEVKMLPLSFKEFRSVFMDEDEQKVFLDYMKFGGMPGNINFIKKNVDGVNKYLDGIFASVVYKDIMIRGSISNKLLLENVLKYIYDNVGSSISSKKISDTLTSKGVKTTHPTVDNYINSYIDSYLIYKADRFDIKGKNMLVRDYKYYTVDVGLRNYLLGKKAGADSGHILENIVYLELLRRGYKVYVGKVNDYEVDFVAVNYNGTHYYQVALSLRDDAVLNRELRSLEKINDNYPKTLLTLDNDLDADYNGINKVNVVSWLLKG